MDASTFSEEQKLQENLDSISMEDSEVKMNEFEKEEAETLAHKPVYTYQQELIAEFIGTFFLVFVGLNSGFSQSTIENVVSQNIQTQVALASGAGVLIGIWLSMDISGAHLNVAVTIMQAVHYDFFQFPAKKILPYFGAQLFGAFVAAAVSFALNLQFINEASDHTGYFVLPNPQATAQYFATYPAPIFISKVAPYLIFYSNNYTNFFDQVLGTFILGMVIHIISDRKSVVSNGKFVPIIISLTIASIITSFSLNCGAPLNPSRDLGPRIFTWPIYGNQVWTAFNGYFWVPLVACPLGAILSGYFYKLIKHQFMAEMVGSMIYLLFGLGGFAQGTLGQQNQGGEVQEPYSSSVGYLVALIMTVKYSCGFFNPAISLVLYLQKKMSLKTFFKNITAQFIGFLIGTSLVFINYLQSILAWSDDYHGQGNGKEKTCIIFFSYPSQYDNHLLDPTVVYSNNWTFAFFQFFGAQLLSIIIIAYNDYQKPQNCRKTLPFVAGFAMFGIQSAFYGGSKPIFNPSYNLANQIIGSIYYGKLLWHQFFWIPLVMPFAGALFSYFIYELFIKYKVKISNEQRAQNIETLLNEQQNQN